MELQLHIAGNVHELIRQLMNFGLSKQQATSTTTAKLVEYFMPDEGKSLILEAKRQVSAMEDMVNMLDNEYHKLVRKMKDMSDTIDAIVEAREKYGEVTEEKAKNVLALYGSLLEMNEKAGADGNDSVKNAGYVLYAYLGGQAKRDVNYMNQDQ